MPSCASIPKNLKAHGFYMLHNYNNHISSNSGEGRFPKEGKFSQFSQFLSICSFMLTNIIIYLTWHPKSTSIGSVNTLGCYFTTKTSKNMLHLRMSFYNILQPLNSGSYIYNQLFCWMQNKYYYSKWKYLMFSFFSYAT